MFIFSILLHFNDFLAFVLRFESEMCGTDMPKVGINLQDFSDGFAATQFSAFIVTFVAKAAISELLRSAPWQGSQLQFLGVSKVTLMDFIPWATRVRESQREQVRSQHGFGKDRRRFFCALHLILKCKIIPRPYRKQENWISLPVVLGKSWENNGKKINFSWGCWTKGSLIPGKGALMMLSWLPRRKLSLSGRTSKNIRKETRYARWIWGGLGSFSPLWKEK